MADVTVESIKWHTTGGQAYPVGATYTVDEAAVPNLVIQGMARPVEGVTGKTGKRKGAKEEPPAKPGRGRPRSTAVAPMTTETVRVARKPARAVPARAARSTRAYRPSAAPKKK